MALADEEDPRETIALILDENADDTDYSNRGSQPGTIDVVESTPFGVKKQDGNDAIYIWQPADLAIEKFGAAGDEKIETVTIQAEAWVPESAGASGAHDLAEDIQAIVQEYTNDSESTTQWTDIFPSGETDFREENIPERADSFIIAVQVDMTRVASL